MKVTKIEVGHLQSNCYILSEGEKCLIIDPGDDVDVICGRMLDLNVNPVALIATHGHFDHILAVTELKLMYTIPFLMHKKDEFLLQRMQSAAYHFTGQKVAPIPTIDIYLKKGNLKIGEFDMEIIPIPGHTPGSVCLYIPLAQIAFVGDLVFADGYVGRTDFVYSDKEILEKSIEKLLKLPKDTVLFCGHGESVTIDEFAAFYK